MSEQNDSKNSADESNKKQGENAEAEAKADKENPEQDTKDNVKELKPDLKEELAKAKNDYLYLYAEFENYKKKMLQERSQFIKYANENLLRDLLQIMDNFHLAISMKVTSENIQSYVDGVNMIAKELENLLEKYHVSKISSKGKNFDPNMHEAIGTEPTDETENGTVYKVHKDGYKLHDRLLRPAQVVIASKKSEEKDN